MLAVIRLIHLLMFIVMLRGKLISYLFVSSSSYVIYLRTV